MINQPDHQGVDQPLGHGWPGWIVCRLCGGKGRIKKDWSDGRLMSWEGCTTCRGSGVTKDV